ncbi:MAG: SDR family oxidoreductase [Phycisphaerae bacterium]|nr:SDR family oxidoreductase [Phycisphaerae bacterium]
MSTATDLNGKRALVTGGSKGIGAASAVALARAGCDVVLTYNSDEAGGKATAAEIEKLGRKTAAIRCDVCDAADVDRAVDEAVKVLGGLDVVFANAGGLIRRCTVMDMEESFFQKLFDLNVTSVFRTVKATVPHLRKAGGGSLIIMSSVAARNGAAAGAVVYGATKGATMTLTRGLGKELAPDNIRVNAVAPGVIDTAFHAATPRDLMDKLKGNITVGRLGVAEDVARAVVFLAGESQGFMTGATIDVNGGMWLA